MVARLPRLTRATRALVFILLLSGAECARIGADAPTSRRGIWTDDDHQVCRERDLKDPPEVVRRYKHKVNKLISLSVELEAHGYTVGAVPKWLELKMRMTRFQSCFQLLKEGTPEGVVPPELLEAMTGTAPTINQVMLIPMKAINGAFDKAEVFPKFDEIPDCHFSLTQLDLVKAVGAENPQNALRKQLFGPDCSDASATHYMNRLDDEQRRAADQILDYMASVLTLKRHVADMEKTKSQSKIERVGKEIIKLAKKLDKDYTDGEERAPKVFGAEAVNIAEENEQGDDEDAILLEIGRTAVGEALGRRSDQYGPGPAGPRGPAGPPGPPGLPGPAGNFGRGQLRELAGTRNNGLNSVLDEKTVKRLLEWRKVTKGVARRKLLEKIIIYGLIFLFVTLVSIFVWVILYIFTSVFHYVTSGLGWILGGIVDTVGTVLGAIGTPLNEVGKALQSLSCSTPIVCDIANAITGPLQTIGGWLKDGGGRVDQLGDSLSGPADDIRTFLSVPDWWLQIFPGLGG